MKDEDDVDNTVYDRLHIQINDYDSYQAFPTKIDKLYAIACKVPIIRIYGSVNVPTSAVSHSSFPHKKPKKSSDSPSPRSHESFNILVHIHNYFPYIYVDCYETNYYILSDSAYVQQFIDYLESTLSESFSRRKGRKGGDDGDEDDDGDEGDYEVDGVYDSNVEGDVRNDGNVPPQDRRRRFIADLQVVKATPIYGFQLGYKLYFKISLLSPRYKTRLNKLIYEKTIDFNQFYTSTGSKKSKKANKTHLVYEGHIPYLLQFLSDFNLYGCGWLYADNATGLYFRNPIMSTSTLFKDNYSSLSINNLRQYLSHFINQRNLLIHPNRIGKSLLEIDIAQLDIILNRSESHASVHSISNRLHANFNELLLFNNNLNTLNSFKSNTYKFDESGNKRIYLSSLKHIYEDLKFQYLSRNDTTATAASIFNDTLSNESISRSNPNGIANAYFGMGSTDWSNQVELNDLLAYVKKLNYSLDSNSSIVNYGKTHFEINNINYRSIRTAYQQIDHEISSKNYALTLKFGKDILQWNDYFKLFDFEDIEAVDSGSCEIEGSLQLNSEIPRIIHVDQVDRDEVELEAGDEEYLSANDLQENDKGQDNSENESDDMEIDARENEEEVEAEVDDSEVNQTQLHEVDEDIITELTQKRNVRKASQLASQSESQARSFDVSTDMLSNPVLEVRNSSEPYDVHEKFNLEMVFAQDRKYYDIRLPSSLNKYNIYKEFDDLGILKINYQDPFYDKEADLPNRPLIFANKKIVIPLNNDTTIPSLPMSELLLKSMETNEKTESSDLTKGCMRRWEYIVQPPSKASMNDWIIEQKQKSIKKSLKIIKSQFELRSEDNEFKFSYNSEKIKRNKDDGFNNLTNFCLEIHVNTISGKLPNPVHDKVTFVIYTFDDSNDMFGENCFKSGILMLSQDLEFDTKIYHKLANLLDSHTHIELFRDELSLIKRLIQIIEIFDPDILSGYEINSLSWGYLIERFRVVYDMNLLSHFSRGDFKSNGKFGDRWGYTHTSNISINGRHMVNVWRLMRSELSLTNYSLENISYHLLHQSLPRYSNLQLSYWLTNDETTASSKLMVLRYYSKRISVIMKLTEIQELITKNVEYSRLIGIDFNSNFYRGSQFKIESILLRITKFENIILNSPSKQQVHEMRPIECIPLIMEPDSNFYKSPLVVLDFQSLYPSIMIAYNYCFSTLVGKLHNYKPNKNDIGYLKNLNLTPGLIDLLLKQNGINISPNGFMFVKSNVRKSILAKMLEEILDTRILVKLIMKEFKDDSELVKLYNSRQLALKLIANVTYGYTSATFSGRMPNSDVSDAIVSTGREILTKSIELIENNDFGGKVVYGDTDSLFVYFPGKSKAEAFKLGRKIADFITNEFPDPVKLKFEKVYHPCVLLTKKRYVGYMYEYEDQTVPKFDAKGIETIRRDGIPAQSKIVEKSLRILFETKNLSQVKQYVMKQFLKIKMNKISINDFCFAKEVRFGTYKNEMYLPPGAIVAAKKVDQDSRQEPQYRERVPYVVVQDSAKPRIKDRCISPEEFIESYSGLDPYYLDYEYYITRVLIPPLERIFNLIGVDVKSWYRELPKMKANNLGTNNVLKMTNFINVNNCLNCGKDLNVVVTNSKYFCHNCQQDELKLMSNLTMELKANEISLFNLNRLCQLCIHNNFNINNAHSLGIDRLNQLSNQCRNSNCRVYHDKFKVKNINLQLLQRNSNIMQEYDNW